MILMKKVDHVGGGEHIYIYIYIYPPPRIADANETTEPSITMVVKKDHRLIDIMLGGLVTHSFHFL